MKKILVFLSIITLVNVIAMSATLGIIGFKKDVNVRVWYKEIGQRAKEIDRLIANQIDMPKEINRENPYSEYRYM